MRPRRYGDERFVAVKECSSEAYGLSHRTHPSCRRSPIDSSKTSTHRTGECPHNGPKPHPHNPSQNNQNPNTPSIPPRTPNPASPAHPQQHKYFPPPQPPTPPSQGKPPQQTQGSIIKTSFPHRSPIHRDETPKAFSAQRPVESASERLIWGEAVEKRGVRGYFL